MTKVAYDLEERTAKFGEQTLLFIKTVPQNNVTSPIINQLVRSATSIGANYCEADNAESKKDFRHKLGIAKKEAKETVHWLRMLAIILPEELKAESNRLKQEAKELNLIFNAITHKLDIKR